MERTQVQTRVGSQPKLSVTNEEISKQFPEFMTIPEDGTHGPAFIGAIGDPNVAKDGNTYIPVAIFQARNDLFGEATEAGAFFREWNGIESLVKHTEGVTPKMMKSLNLEVGKTIPKAQIFVDYQAGKQFFSKGDGSDQDPVLDPTSEEYMAVPDQGLLYRNTRLQFGENLQHTGLDLRRAAERVTEEQKDALQEQEAVETPGSTVVDLS